MSLSWVDAGWRLSARAIKKIDNEAVELVTSKLETWPQSNTKTWWDGESLRIGLSAADLCHFFRCIKFYDFPLIKTQTRRSRAFRFPSPLRGQFLIARLSTSRQLPWCSFNSFPSFFRDNQKRERSCWPFFLDDVQRHTYRGAKCAFSVRCCRTPSSGRGCESTQNCWYF